MSKKKKEVQEIFIQGGKLTFAELKEKMEAIASGKEPLPDGSRYPDKKDDVHVRYYLTLELLETPREDFLDFFTAPKQLLDFKLRSVREKDLNLPSPPGINRNEMLAAIQGGLNSVDLNFLESSLLHAVVEAFSKADYPEKISLSRAGLYELMGVEKSLSASGREYFQEGGLFWRTRKRYHDGLMELSRKSFPFVFRWRTGEDKKGGPRYTLALTYDSLIKVAAIYPGSKETEIPGILKGGRSAEKRFSHYEIKLNPAARGEVDHYFRYLPSSLGKEISSFRTTMGQRASVHELNFIEFLYTVGHEVIEINYLKLAEKIKIKTKKLRNPAETERRIRKVLSRCYETALALAFALEILENQPAAREKTKEIIRLNPEKFKDLQQGNLFEETEA